MSALVRGLIVAAVHLAIVCSLAAKYYVDRAVLPRTWVRTVGYDPEAFIRGRYVTIALLVDAPAATPQGSPRNWSGFEAVRLQVVDGRLRATPDPRGNVRLLPATAPGTERSIGPVAFFIPPRVADPSLRRPGEELWAEVTVPKRGLPRPIRLAVKRDGRLEPLAF